MANYQPSSSYCDSDDDEELPALDVLLARLPGRTTQLQPSRSRTILDTRSRETTVVNLEEDEEYCDGSEKGSAIKKPDPSLRLSRTAREESITSLATEGIQKRWWPSSRKLRGDHKFDKGATGINNTPPTLFEESRRSLMTKRSQQRNGLATKKSFEAKKTQLATDFLHQLDTRITHGKIGELTESTGGVKIVWSNTLKTTAGRANWKRETVVSKHTSDSGAAGEKQYRHHSSIELSEKVIDDEQRLLNVIAHEFCHLANFMVNGITDNPHGKEFKAWAAKCSQSFASQGIKVTTKHSYEIDFKYVWACTACGCEYKRHSKSIDPKRHRCGACKAALEQTKPPPRQTPAAGQLSGYQLFVKEQMKVVKSENPTIPQKEIMGIIAEKWAKAKN
ncbi:hypothetical protein TgHK011_010187 [Trichoderma gracile]|nr:hypothetical protein TgHK011_010187 [Trichoderma gracile]